MNEGSLLSAAGLIIGISVAVFGFRLNRELGIRARDPLDGIPEEVRDLIPEVCGSGIDCIVASGLTRSSGY